MAGAVSRGTNSLIFTGNVDGLTTMQGDTSIPWTKSRQRARGSLDLGEIAALGSRHAGSVGRSACAGARPHPGRAVGPADLADLGADVVKVERSKTGDDTRAWGPPFIEAKDGGHLGAAYFHSTNRGKRSIEADFESENGKRIVKKLAARSDVLIENFKVGGLAKFGLDYKNLAAECPRLIYCSVTGFGQDGPYATRAGYDLMAQGMGGFMSLTGTADGEPTRGGVPVSDIFAGDPSVIGILAALAQRERTGKGCYGRHRAGRFDRRRAGQPGHDYLASGTVPARIGNAHPNIVPYQVFTVADGYIIIATGNDSQYVRAVRACSARQSWRRIRATSTTRRGSPTAPSSSASSPH